MLSGCVLLLENSLENVHDSFRKQKIADILQRISGHMAHRRDVLFNKRHVEDLRFPVQYWALGKRHRNCLWCCTPCAFINYNIRSNVLSLIKEQPFFHVRSKTIVHTLHISLHLFKTSR